MPATLFLRQIASLPLDQAERLGRDQGFATHVLPAPQDLPRLAAAARAIAASLGRGAPAVLLLTGAQDATLDGLGPHLLGYDRLYALAPTPTGAGLLSPGQTDATPLPDPCTLLALLILSPAAS